MATKSFTSEFKFNQKASSKLAEAMERSRRVDHEIKQRVEHTVREEGMQKIMKNFLAGHNN